MTGGFQVNSGSYWGKAQKEIDRYARDAIEMSDWMARNPEL
jgi:hypothetical protein